MLRLRPYRKEDAKHIVIWCKEERDFYKWTAGLLGAFPITAERMNDAVSERIENETFFPFVAVDEDGPAGFFILRQPGDKTDELRFGFIILNPDKRGKGYGKQMLQLGMKYALEIYGAQKLSLGVFENNPQAYYCYTSVGFKENKKDEPKVYHILDETWKCIEMVYEKPVIKGIHHVSLKCTTEEFEAAKTFYRKVLNLKIVRTWNEGIMFDTDNGLVEIFCNGPGIKDQGAIRHFSLAVSDVDAIADSVQKAGYDVFIPPKDIILPSEPKLYARIAFCTGPLGEQIELFQEKEA